MGTGGKAQPGDDINHSPLSSALVKNESELYLLLPLASAWRVAGQLYFTLLYTLLRTEIKSKQTEAMRIICQFNCRRECDACVLLPQCFAGVSLRLYFLFPYHKFGCGFIFTFLGVGHLLNIFCLGCERSESQFLSGYIQSRRNRSSCIFISSTMRL
jgi:hypothetical protein